MILVKLAWAFFNDICEFVWKIVRCDIWRLTWGEVEVVSTWLFVRINTINQICLGTLNDICAWNFCKFWGATSAAGDIWVDLKWIWSRQHLLVFLNLFVRIFNDICVKNFCKSWCVSRWYLGWLEMKLKSSALACFLCLHLIRERDMNEWMYTFQSVTFLFFILNHVWT